MGHNSVIPSVSVLPVREDTHAVMASVSVVPVIQDTNAVMSSVSELPVGQDTMQSCLVSVRYLSDRTQCSHV